MNSILSIFICLAMLMTGAYTAEDPAAPAAMVAIISDVVVSLNGEDYALPQTLSLGVATEDNSALLDFFVTSGDDTLFPVQAKFDEAGLSLLLGSSNTAYVLSNEYLGADMASIGLPESFVPFMESYFRLLASASQFSPDSEQSAQLDAYLFELAADTLVTEGTTLTIDGAEVPATHTTFSLDSAQIGQLVEYGFSLLEPEFPARYMEFMAESIAVIGEEEAAPASFSDFYAEMGMRMDVDMTATEDGLGEATITVSADIEGETVEIPIEMTMQSADTADIRMNCELEGLEMSMTCLVDGQQMDMNLTINSPEDGASAAITSYADMGEDGSVSSLRMYFTDEEGSVVDLYFSETTDTEQHSVSDLSLLIESEGESFGLSFRITAEPSAIEDRIAAAKPAVITSDEDQTAFTGLGLAAAGMTGDVEKLMNDESVSALISAFSELMAAEEDDFSLYPDDGVTYGEDDPADLSFTIPEFTWLPEDYELTDTSVWATGDKANLSFEYTGDDDEYHSPLYISLYGSPTLTSYALNADGAFSAVDTPAFSIDQESSYIYATGVINGIEIHLSYYGDDFTVDNFASLINGMVFAE